MRKTEHDQLLPLAASCRDDAEVLAISVLRFIAAGYMTGDVACWDAAHDGAERVLGPLNGGKLVAACVSLVRAIRREREAAWNFLPATCCRVTRDERELLQGISLARAGGECLASAAAAITRRCSAPAVAAALHQLAAELNAVRTRLGRQPGQGPSPQLH